MNVLNLLQDIDQCIKEHSQDDEAQAFVRTLTIYREVILYLIENKKITASDNEKAYYDFILEYTPKDLYKVAEHYRRSKGNAPLNYQAYR